MLYEEVDYTREGKNAERFSENFKGTEWIKAPGINWSRSSSKVRCACVYVFFFSSLHSGLGALCGVKRSPREGVVVFPVSWSVLK